MRIDCPSLAGGALIPTKYANKGVRGGQNVSLAVSWRDAPSETQSFVLTIIDRHPVARNWVHWIVVDIPSSVSQVAENASGHAGVLPEGSKELRNSFGTLGYGGPQPPRGSGPHQYEITIHALNVAQSHVPMTASLDEVQRELKGKVIDSASVVGTFEQ